MQPPDEYKRTLTEESARLAELDGTPSFSLLTPLFNTPPRFLEELIASCRLQTWRHWELLLVDDGSTETTHIAVAETWAALDPRIKLIRCEKNGGISKARNVAIRASRGAFVAALDHDDLLHPQALGLVARLLRRKPDVNFLYSNELKINEETTQISRMLVKPDFDLATLERVNYICHLTVIARKLLDLVKVDEETWFRPQYDGVEDHDLFLRLARRSEIRPFHLPLYIYYWRKAPGSTAESLDEKPYVFERGAAMLREHFASLGADAIARQGARGKNLFFSVRLAPTPGKKLAVVIPYKDQAPLTVKCLQSLRSQVHALDLTVVLVDNGSVNPNTETLLRGQAQNMANIKIVWHPAPGAFNFARLNNAAIDALADKPDFILFLNNDVELLSSDALSAMAGEVEHHPRTAFVGLKLWYPGAKDLQHGGIKFTPAFNGLGFHRTDHVLSEREYVHDEHIAHAVTFACAMVRFAVWRELRGLEEEFFPNGFGDVDICTRAIQSGYVNFYLGTLEGIHHESKTRRSQNEDLEAGVLSLFYPAELAQARRTQMGYDLRLSGLLDSADSDWFEMHLRYRVADKVNAALKKIAGPLHKILRRRLAAQ